MVQALIGHTGFVGGNLLRQEAFELRFNSSNIQDIEGRSLDRVVCAGVSAVKWWANKNPEEDWSRIHALIDHLSNLEVGCFTLISTIDVYNPPNNVTEDDRPDEAALHPYGLHRLRLEDFVRRRFSRCHIVRLPALFGAGLKKNAIFDLINDNMMEVINPASSFQWYPVRRLRADLEIVETSGLSLVNFAAPPLTMGEIHRRFFPSRAMGAKANAEAHYDMRTKHSDVFGRADGYILSRDDVFAELAAYLSAESRA